MKRVIHPVGNLLTTAAFGSITLNFVAALDALALAKPQDSPLDDPPDGLMAEMNKPELLEASTPVPVSVPERLPVGVFPGEADIPRADIDANPVDAEPSQLVPSENIATDPLEQARQQVTNTLAELVERDRPEREAQLRENLQIATLHYAETGDFERARLTAENPVLLQTEQADLLAHIDELEATRTSLVTETVPVVEPDIAASPSNPGPGVSPMPLSEPVSISYGVRGVCATSHQDPSITLNQPGRLNGNSGGTTPTIELDSKALEKYSPKCEWIAQQGNNLFTVIRNQSFAMLYPLAHLAPITSHFGWRVHPIFGDRRFHHGTDFGAPAGTPVVAALPGLVETAGYLNGYGLTVILEHGDLAKKTLYAHLSDLAVAPGTHVEQGVIIGWVGSTGNSTGPHLHFEVHQRLQGGWVTVDPLGSAEFVQVEGRMPVLADRNEWEPLGAIAQIQQIEDWLK
jgi:murein DD-endopeptidase MepM/ murein hydrolase activator NlpD